MRKSIRFMIPLFVFALMAACTNYTGQWVELEKWKVGPTTVKGALQLKDSDKAVYTGRVCGGEFKNFELTARVKPGEGSVARLWLHTDEKFSKGYSTLLNGGSDERRQSGSLEAVRNFYKKMVEAGQPFNLYVAVKGKVVEVKINETTVVRYAEPPAPYRTKTYEGMKLSAGNFVIDVQKGEVELTDIKVQPLADTLAEYAEGVVPVDEQTDDIIKMQQRNFPVIDYHVHLKGWDKNQALDSSLLYGINYGIAPNCGIGFPITNDQQVLAYLDENKSMPFFYAMQGEGREWVHTFSPEVRNKFDYVFTDAMTFLDHKNRRTRLWMKEEVFMDIPVEKYMDVIVDRAVKVLSEEPIDIWVNPTFLPDQIMDSYDKLWTPERADRVIAVLKERGIALEINARYRIPHPAFLKAAKAAGVKFSFGTNNSNPDIGKLEYCIEMIRELELTPEDMFFPPRY